MKEKNIRKNFIKETENNNLGIWERSILIRLLSNTKKIELRGETTYLVEVNEVKIELDFKENICILGNSFLNYLIFPTETEKQTGIKVLHFILFGTEIY